MYKSVVGSSVFFPVMVGAAVGVRICLVVVGGRVGSSAVFPGDFINRSLTTKSFWVEISPA